MDILPHVGGPQKYIWYPNFFIQPAKNSLHPLIVRVETAAKLILETLRGNLMVTSLTSPTILDAPLVLRFLRNLKLCDCVYTTTHYSKTCADNSEPCSTGAKAITNVCYTLLLIIFLLRQMSSLMPPSTCWLKVRTL